LHGSLSVIPRRRLHVPAQQWAAPIVYEIKARWFHRLNALQSGTRSLIPAFRYGCYQAGRAMQFLAYLAVLMLSVSTVLLEVHWLTSPAPQSKPVIQATSTPVPVAKAEGPNAALSPVYPKKSDTAPPVDAAANVQPSNAVTEPQSAFTQPSATRPNVSVAPTQRSPAETTGMAARNEDSRQPAPTTANVPERVPPEAASTLSSRCDVQACAGTYKSFRASDCTYQSFEGPRRVCTKPAVQRTMRGQMNESERRKWNRDIIYPRGVDRSTMGRRIDDENDDNAADFDEGTVPIVVRRLGPRW